MCRDFYSHTGSCRGTGAYWNRIDTWSDRGDWNGGRSKAVHRCDTWYMQRDRVDL